MKYGHNAQNNPAPQCSEGGTARPKQNVTVIFLDKLEMFDVPAITRSGASKIHKSQTLDNSPGLVQIQSRIL
jgi:hypothetical protein